MTTQTATRTRSANDVLTSNFGITTRTAVANILAVWASASDASIESGTTWYDTARHHAETIAESTGMTVETAAAVIAHLSPRTRWAHNVAAAYAIATTGIAPAGTIGRNADNALAAIVSADPLATLHGPKTAAFARNILGDEQAVTVDVWAVRIAVGGFSAESALARVGSYDAIAHAYRIAAARVGVTPAVMQAVTWVTARNGRAN